MSRFALGACLLLGVPGLASATTVTYLDAGGVGRYASLAVGTDGRG